MKDQGTLGGVERSAAGVSADGSVVVGRARNAAGQWRAFRWTVDGGMQDLGTLPGGPWSGAYGVSAYGAVVVGWSLNAAAQYRAFRWTASGGMQDLGTLPGGDRSWAYGVSADGSVVVGWSYNNATGPHRAFRWQNGVMQDLGVLLGGTTVAYDVSADGSVVVGVTNASIAFRWTASRGMEDLNRIYGGGGRWYLSVAYAISPDGRYIVGSGANYAENRYQEAFLLDTRCTLRGDVNGDGIVDDADLLIVLFNFGSRCR
jgi:probable HAF family extracellular repeat protein